MAPLDQIDDWDVPNAVAAVFTPSEVLGTRGDTTVQFQLASVSKVLAAITTHVAVEEGSIGLDDPAGPEGSTVAHLLSHASGLAPDGNFQVLGPPGNRRIYSNLGFEELARHLEARTGMPYEDTGSGPDVRSRGGRRRARGTPVSSCARRSPVPAAVPP